MKKTTATAHDGPCDGDRVVDWCQLAYRLDDERLDARGRSLGTVRDELRRMKLCT